MKSTPFPPRSAFFSMAALALLSAAPALAREISSAEAGKAASAWVRRDNAPLGAALASDDVAEVRTASDDADTPLFHVVRLSGGGVVVTSAESGVTPIVAFLDGDDVDEADGNPLWTILQADMAARLAHIAAVRDAAISTGLVSHAPRTRDSGNPVNPANPVQNAPFAAAEAAWADLLADEAPAPSSRLRKAAAIPDASGLSDLRVPALLATKWDQRNGAANYYTPSYAAGDPANYPCGCVALAGAQMANYWQFPAGSRPQVTRMCYISDVETNCTTFGGTYDWANMPPLDFYSAPLALAQRQAVGKLCYDFGVATRMNWGPNDSGTVNLMLAEAFTEVFGYANAMAYSHFGDVMPDDLVERAVLANLDAGCPVTVSLAGHSVVADGYGYSSGTLYTHLNFGWSGLANAWYNLPDVEDEQTGYTSSILDEVVYNVFPTNSCELLTGRVLDGGNPVSGAAVTATSAFDSVTGTTDARGIYALRVTDGRAWTVVAESAGQSGSLTAIVAPSISARFERSAVGSSITYPGQVGNSWGNDVTLGVDAAAPSLAEALDNTELAFTTAGDGEWYGQADESHDGEDAARTAPLLDSEVAWLQTTVTGPGTLSFWWNVSSEQDYDWLELYVDEDRVAAISGTNNVWQQMTVPVTGGGTHAVIWSYLKDQYTSWGEDCGWVDQVVWTPAGDLFVDATNGSDANDGRSWATAKASIQAAVDAASDGDTIVVADGRYEPISTANKAISICSLNGPETTIIDGSLQWVRGVTNRCATLGSTMSHTATFLSGFTLTNGIAATYGGGSQYGTLENCFIAGNRAASGGGSHYGTLRRCQIYGNTATSGGGGAYETTLTECELYGNSAKSGGGSYYGTLTDCTIENNTATSDGGGSNYGTLRGCTIWGNSAKTGGGAYRGTLTECQLFGNSATANGGGAYYATLTDCTLSGNHATGSGGGTYYGELANCELYENRTDASGGGSYNGTLDGCTLAGNTAAASGGGAAEATLTGCDIWGNSARNGGGVGGATLTRCTVTNNTATMYGGGAYEATLSFCQVNDNTADNGGGTYKADLADCTVAGNTASTSGGGVYNGSATRCGIVSNKAGGSSGAGGGSYGAALDNCILVYNEATAGNGGGVYNGALTNCTLYANEAANNGGGAYYATLANCIVWGNTAPNNPAVYLLGKVCLYSCLDQAVTGDANVGNIVADPLFAGSSNWRLEDGSPCINAGDNDLAVGETDFYGNPRVIRETVDMGASEYDFPPPAWAAGADAESFWDWVDANNVADYRTDYTAQFLLNVAPGATPAALHVDDITVLDNGATINVSATAGGDPVNLTDINGVLLVDVGFALTNLVPKAVPAANVWHNDATRSATIFVSSLDGSFMRARVGFPGSSSGNLLPPPTLVIRPETGTQVMVGETIRLRAIIVLDNGTEIDITQSAAWTSADPEKATVSQGVVRGVAEDDAVAITASAMGAATSIDVKVGYKYIILNSVWESVPDIERYLGYTVERDTQVMQDENGDEGEQGNCRIYRNGVEVTDLVLPSTFTHGNERYCVSGVDQGAFQYCVNLRSVTMSDTASYIGVSAFKGCTNLQSVSMAPIVNYIGEYAFQDCSALTGLTLPDELTYILEATFKNCSSLTNIVVPALVGWIDKNAFAGCGSLRTVALPASLVSIGEEAFRDCGLQGALVLPASVQSLGNGAFRGCAGLMSATIPARITAIPDNLFADCQNLRTVALFTGSADNPPVLASIGQSAFEECQNLQSVTIPGLTANGTYHGVTDIGEKAFKDCYSIDELTVPDGVDSIGDEAFGSVSHITYHGTAGGAPWGANGMN